MHAQGFVSRIDVAKAVENPARSVGGGMQAGCNPVRAAVSPDGRTLAVGLFDARRVDFFTTPP